MAIWKRRTIGILTLGGSAMGVVLILTQLMSAPPAALVIVISLVFIALYSVGIVAGVLFLEKNQRAYVFALPFWLLQIPVFASKLFVYDFFVGAGFTVSLNESGIFRMFPAFGSQFNFQIGGSELPFTLGVNLFAIYLSFVIWKHKGKAL